MRPGSVCRHLKIAGRGLPARKSPESPARVYNGARFGVGSERLRLRLTTTISHYAPKSSLRKSAEKAGAAGREGDEECPCSVFEVSRGSGHPADQWQDLFRV